MEDNLKPGPQFNLPELAKRMSEVAPTFSYESAHAFLNVLFQKVIPDVIHEGTPIVIQGFGTFYKHEDQEFNNPSTEDPKDRVFKTKVHFRPADLLDIRADKDTI